MMKERIKKFCLRIWDKIEDHLAKYISGLIIAFFTIALIILRKWLAAKHSLKMYGWLWILILFTLVSVPVLIFWLLKRRKILYEEDGDVKVVLEEQLERLTRLSKDTVRIDYRIWDKKLSLKKGSTKRFLKHILAKFENIWCIDSEGENTMNIVRVEEPQLRTQ
ncbi:MAG: hypothetical protein ACYS9C_05260 [Planctomycetota bacterium]|jgi:hypothetical protein